MTPDLILLDIRLPEKSGLEIAKEVKENDQTKNIPLIAVSGTSNIDDSRTFLGRFRKPAPSRSTIPTL